MSGSYLHYTVSDISPIHRYYAQNGRILAELYGCCGLSWICVSSPQDPYKQCQSSELQENKWRLKSWLTATFDFQTCNGCHLLEGTINTECSALHKICSLPMHRVHVFQIPTVVLWWIYSKTSLISPQYSLTSLKQTLSLYSTNGKLTRGACPKSIGNYGRKLRSWTIWHFPKP